MIDLCIWQVMFPIDANSFLSDDLALLESMEFKQRIKYILEIIEEVNWEHVDPDLLTRSLLVPLTNLILPSSYVKLTC